MSPEQIRFLTLLVMPSRLNPEQTAWYLGFTKDDIPLLIAAGLLKPLGRPSRSSVKFFALVELEQLRRDVKWLSRAVSVVQGYWRAKNLRRSGSAGDAGLEEDSPAA
jgi:hypothetical protein